MNSQFTFEFLCFYFLDYLFPCTFVFKCCLLYFIYTHIWMYVSISRNASHSHILISIFFFGYRLLLNRGKNVYKNIGPPKKNSNTLGSKNKSSKRKITKQHINSSEESEWKKIEIKLYVYAGASRWARNNVWAMSNSVESECGPRIEWMSGKRWGLLLMIVRSKAMQ